jgi:hypothetical protein
MAEGRILFDIAKGIRTALGHDIENQATTGYQQYLKDIKQSNADFESAEPNSFAAIFGGKQEVKSQNDWRQDHFNPSIKFDNQSKFLSPEIVSQLADIYQHTNNPAGHIYNSLPPFLRNTDKAQEDFGTVSLQNDIHHIFEQGYKEKIANQLGLPDYFFSIGRSPELKEISVHNFDDNSLTPLASNYSRRPGDAILIPKSHIAQAFVDDPTTFLKGVREHTKFIDDSNEASFGALMDYANEAKAAKQASDIAAEAATPAARRASFKVIGRNLFKDNNTVKALIPAATGLGILGTGLSSQDALALPTNDEQGNYIGSDVGSIMPVEHPYLNAAADLIDKYAQIPIPLMERPLSGVSNELRNFGRERPAGQRLEDAMGAVTDFAGIPENIAAGIYSAGRNLFAFPDPQTGQ